MQTYTVHEPSTASATIEDRATRLVFVKEGIALFALFAPVIWLAYNRLWRELLIFLVATFIVVLLVVLAGGNESAVAWATFLINLIFAFEARDIHRRALERKGYMLTGIVTGQNLADSEQRFLREWLPGRRVAGNAAGNLLAVPAG